MFISDRCITDTQVGLNAGGDLPCYGQYIWSGRLVLIIALKSFLRVSGILLFSQNENKEFSAELFTVTSF